MIIKSIQIDNFGHFHNFQIDDLSKGVNKITGLNEFGKTTIAEFIVRVFFGFPDKKRQKLNPYPAACDDANYGGRVICELADGREVTIERVGKNKKQRFSIIDNARGEELLFEDVFKLDENFYREIYALTLLQLAKGGVLEEQDNAVSRRLYGMNYAAKNVDINGLIKKLSERSDKIFLPAGRTQELICQYELLKNKQAELDLLEDKLRKSEKLDLEIAELEKQLKMTSNRCSAVADYLNLKQKLAELDAKIAEIQNRINSLNYSQAFLEYESIIEELLQSIKLNQEYHNNLLVSKIELETLEKELKHVDNEFDKVLDDEKFQHKLMDFGLRDEQCARKDKENGDYNIRLDSKRKRIFSIIQMLLMFMIIGILSGMLMYNFGNQANGKLFMVGCTIVCVLLLAIRLVLQKIMKMLPTDYADKLHLEFVEFLANYELEKYYSIVGAINKFTESRRVAKEHEKLLLIREDYRQKRAKLESMDADLLEICKKLDYPREEGKNYEESVIQLKSELKRHQMIMVNKNALSAELEKEFKQRDVLRTQLQKSNEELQQLGLVGVDETGLQLLKKEFYTLNAQTAVKRNEYAELLEQDDLEIVKSDLASLKNQTRKMADNYLTLQLILHYIREGIEKFEREHQGEIIDRASEYFSYISNNRYVRVKKSLENGEIICITLDNKERNLTELSTGSREQLLLAMRLSLIDYIEKNIEPLPVILDDVFVNFDYQRKAKMEEIVEKFAKNRQVLIFKLANAAK